MEFENYLKKINQDGDNYKKRILSRRIKKFERYSQRSVYSSEITDEYDNHFNGVIHPEKDNEKTCIYKFLTDRNNVFSLGQLIFDEEDRTWLIYHQKADVTIGYNCYSVILLRENFTIENGDEKFTFPGRIVNDSAEDIEDFLSTISGTNRQYREPDRTIRVVCKNYDYFQKDLKMMIAGDTYKIEGINKTAVPGCAYLTLGQCLTDTAKNDGEADFTNNSFWGDV